MSEATIEHCPDEPSNNHRWSTIGGEVIPEFMEEQETHVIQQCKYCNKLRKNNDIEHLGDDK